MRHHWFPAVALTSGPGVCVALLMLAPVNWAILTLVSTGLAVSGIAVAAWFIQRASSPFMHAARRH